MQTVENIVDDEPLDITLKLDRADEADHDSIDCWVHFVDAENQFVKCTIFKNNEYSGYNWDSAKYYEFQQVTGDVYEGTVGIKPNWDTEITPLDTPPEAFNDDSDSTDESPHNDGAVISPESTRLALDIEVLTLVDEEELDLDDPTHVEMLCIGVGYQPSPSLPAEATVLFRQGDTPQDELNLLIDLCEWIDARPAQALLTFGGDGFDLDHLRDRARLAEETCGEKGTVEPRITEILDGLTSVDLRHTAQQAFGYSSSLESSCRQVGIPVVETHWDIYGHDLEPESWRETQWEAWSNPPDKPLDHRNVLGSDVPFFGEQYLGLVREGEDTVETRAIRELLRAYTQSDIIPLFSLAEEEPFISNYSL